jgi:2'-5' RNA ligase
VSERLFLAVALSDDVRHGLAAFITDQTMGLPGRPTAPEGWHVTLRLLGATTALQRDMVLEFLDDHLVVEPFTLGFDTMGAFPMPSRGSVLWLGVGRGVAGMGELARICEAAAVSVGFEQEDRRFHPHMTLARMRPPQDLESLIERVPRFPLTMTVDRVTLYRSDLHPDGARYEVVDEVLL